MPRLWRWSYLKKLRNKLEELDLGKRLKTIEETLADLRKTIKEQGKTQKEQEKTLEAHSKVMVEQTLKAVEVDNELRELMEKAETSTIDLRGLITENKTMVKNELEAHNSSVMEVIRQGFATLKEEVWTE